MNIWPFLAQAAGAACPLCAEPGDGVCRHCRERLPFNRHACPRCALPLPPTTPPQTLCGACQRRPPHFDRALAALRYEAPVDDLIAGFKYHQRLALGPALAEILATVIENVGAWEEAARPELLVPVPAAAARLRERGFNQAAELARHLSARLGIPWSAGILARAAAGRPQRGLDRVQRQRNQRGSIRLVTSPPHRVALIDDVITTGSTAGEASRIIKAGGAGRVDLWAVARTPPSPYSVG